MQQEFAELQCRVTLWQGYITNILKHNIANTRTNTLLMWEGKQNVGYSCWDAQVVLLPYWMVIPFLFDGLKLQLK